MKSQTARYKELKEKARDDKDALTKEERREYKDLKEIMKKKQEEKKESDAKPAPEPKKKQAASATKKDVGSWEDWGEEEVPENSNPSPSDSGSDPVNKSGSSKRKKSPIKRVEQTVTEESLEPENRWWTMIDDPDDLKKETIKWQSLEHHGLIFAPDYEPHGIPLLYGPPGQKEQLVLPTPVEELATYWCAVIGLDAETKPIFINNFWGVFRKEMQNYPDLLRKITEFKYCDFSKMHKAIQEGKETLKNKPREQKEREAKERNVVEEKYRYCLIEGIREKVGTFRVEPPGLFRGRGEHPHQGKLKERVMPEDCTMNVDNALAPPICMIPGRAWGDIVHDDTVSWLGYFKDGKGDSMKYMMMDKTSKAKTMPDLMKYERAKRLSTMVADIRKDYQYKLKFGKDAFVRQLGTCAYFIDRLALRVGGEKNTDEEADTIRLDTESWRNHQQDPKSPPKLTLDFLGKDSIRYLNEVAVPPTVFKNVAALIKGKSDSEQMFDRVSPSDINSYLQEFMQDLTAKVFRTYNASYTLEQQLLKFKPGEIDFGDQDALLKFFNEANRKVAVLCNHQKAAGKGHSEAVEKLTEKAKALSQELKVLKQHLNLLENGQGGLDADENNPYTQKLPKDVQATKKKMIGISNRTKKLAHQIEIKEGNKNVSLTTSKINYMDPRVAIAFCKRTGLDISKVYSKATVIKFPWAMDVDGSYRFFTAPPKAQSPGAKAGDAASSSRPTSPNPAAAGKRTAEGAGFDEAGGEQKRPRQG